MPSHPCSKFCTTMEVFQSLVISLFVLLTFFVISRITKSVKRKLEGSSCRSAVPPGPKRLPLIGNLHQLAHPLHKSLQTLSRKYGPLMFLQLGAVPTIVISSADMAKEVFKGHDLAFSGRPSLYSAKKITYNCSSVSFAPYGDYWREIRKIMTLQLLTAKMVKSYQSVRQEEVGMMIDAIAASSSCSGVNISELTLSLANNIVCRVAFGRRGGGGVNGEKSRFHELLQETQNLLAGFCIADFFPWLHWVNSFNGVKASLDKCFRELNSFYDRVIEEHRDDRCHRPEIEDIVDALIRIQKDPDQPISLTDEQIKAVLTDIFIAGTDTSSATLTWIMAELMMNPFVMEKAQREVREAMKGKEKVQEEDISNLTYLKLVIKEGLRLHPPAPLLLPRETLENSRIQSYDIPAGTRVFVDAKSIASDHKYWENPNEFRPERFSGSSVDYKGQHYEFLPFGVGRRSCPGLNFGVQVIEIALANLVLCFDWELVDGEELDMDEAVGITVHKRVPLRLSAKRRIY